MPLEIAAERLEVAESALGLDEAELHQPSRRIIDEDEQGARSGPVLEPAVLAAVDLHEFAEMLAPQPRLVQRPPLPAGPPQPGFEHPAPQRLA